MVDKVWQKINNALRPIIQILSNMNVHCCEQPSIRWQLTIWLKAFRQRYGHDGGIGDKRQQAHQLRHLQWDHLKICGILCIYFQMLCLLCLVHFPARYIH